MEDFEGNLDEEIAAAKALLHQNAEANYQKLLDDREINLEVVHGERAGFEARLKLRWREPLELFDLAWVYSRCIYKTLEEREPKEGENEFLCQVMTAQFARALTCALEVGALLRCGHVSVGFRGPVPAIGG